MVAQNKGAGAVLATSWPVADASTSAFMADLYRRLAAGGTPRAEAVRLAQLALLGSGGADAAPARGLTVSGDEAGSPWAHPYHWAPFVLYGTGS